MRGMFAGLHAREVQMKSFRCGVETAAGGSCRRTVETAGEQCHLHTNAGPRKLDDLTLKRICDALELGATYERAAAAGGISYTSFARWRREQPAFAAAVEAAEWKATAGWLGSIRDAAGGDWRAAAWMLERRYPREYGKDRPQLPTDETVQLRLVLPPPAPIRRPGTLGDLATDAGS